MITEYFETRFRTEEQYIVWPEQFVIITAYATTGEVWSDERNRKADDELRSCLSGLASEIRRITGYSPKTGHMEPGWAVELELEKAKEIGRLFMQDAIYIVESGSLWVIGCEKSGSPIFVDEFLGRLD